MSLRSGYMGIVRPNEMEIEWKEIQWETEIEEEKKLAFDEIIETVTGSVNGTITNMGYLPKPIDNYTAFIDFDQFNPETKYNFNIFGNPVYNTICFLYVDKETENGDIYPIQEEQKEELSNFVMNMKKFEKESGIFEAISNTSKEDFLKSFIEEKNNAIKEASDKNVIPKKEETEYDKEIKRAKEELKTFNEEGKITDEMKKEFNLKINE